MIGGRSVRLVKWLALAATALLLATIAINTVYEFGWRFSPRVVASAQGGCFMVTWTDPPARIGTYWSQDDGEWGPGGRKPSQGWFTRETTLPAWSSWTNGLTRIRLPFWCLLLPSAALVLVAHRAERRARAAGSCPQCSYDLTGNATGVCPECGASVSPRHRV